MNIQKSNKPIEGGSIDWLIWFEMIWLVTAKTEIIYANDQLEKIFKKKREEGKHRKKSNGQRNRGLGNQSKIAPLPSGRYTMGPVRRDWRQQAELVASSGK